MQKISDARRLLGEVPIKDVNSLEGKRSLPWIQASMRTSVLPLSHGRIFFYAKD